MAELIVGWNDTISMSIFKRSKWLSLIKYYWIDTIFYIHGQISMLLIEIVDW